MRSGVVACAVAVLMLSACGSGSDADSGSSADATTVIVANGNDDDGSAQRMTEELSQAGFTTGEPTSSENIIEDSIVYYASADGAETVAQSVAEALGGVDVLSLPDPAPIESGELEGAGVLLLLGQDQADKTLDELSGVTTTTATAAATTTAPSGGSTTTAPSGGSTTTGPIGGTVPCDADSIKSGIGGDVASVDSFQCDEGWAGAAYTDNDGNGSNAILEAEGQFWILQDWNTVCDGDTQVPESLRVYCPGG
ncbi:LytR C-terminal domain-containing protein [Ilumatobacter sp.]|uniref:LytR C-terminal domain-containing protein n=1 Tax=Ilumatobacter sp. TaxID=1967498 RepID=UPI003C549219